jgi:hydrogenase nickel incorporation protein HypA/HybF
MHELGIAQAIVEEVSERARGARVLRVVLQLGKLAAVLPDALQFCFDLAAQETPLAGASLEIIEVPGRARCRECGGDVQLDRPFGRCACGSTSLEWLAGEELIIKEFEVASCAKPAVAPTTPGPDSLT